MQVFQEKPSNLWVPANIINIQICIWAYTNFPMKMSGVKIIGLYDRGAIMRYLSNACYAKLKDLPSLKMVSVMLIHSATGHDLHPTRLTCCQGT